MAAVLVAASYSREGFSPFLAVSARHVRVSGGTYFHLETSHAVHVQKSKD